MIQHVFANSQIFRGVMRNLYQVGAWKASGERITNAHYSLVMWAILVHFVGKQGVFHTTCPL